jgi:uncharacterized protein with PIN domain
MNAEPPTFVVDAMLGRLAKWLRILGYDAVFDATAHDAQLARMARADGRILLTRDQTLAQRRGLQTVLVDSEEPEAQLRQVVTQLNLRTDHAFSRCPVCNELLESLTRQAAQALVPRYVWHTHDRFRMCPACGRVYWPGTHWQAMDGVLARLDETLEPKTEGELWNQENWHKSS